MILKKQLMLLFVLLGICCFILVSSYAEETLASDIVVLAEEDIEKADAFITEKTKEWEKTYGDYRLWRYEVLAAFGAEYGSVPGPNFNNGAVPTWPDIYDISEEQAIDLAFLYLPCYGNKLVKKEDLEQCTISTRFSKARTDGSYISMDGTWIIGFWKENGSEPELLCNIYLDGNSASAQFAYFPDDAAYPGSPDNAERLGGS